MAPRLRLLGANRDRRAPRPAHGEELAEDRLRGKALADDAEPAFASCQLGMLDEAMHDRQVDRVDATQHVEILASAVPCCEGSKACSPAVETPNSVAHIGVEESSYFFITS